MSSALKYWLATIAVLAAVYGSSVAWRHLVPAAGGDNQEVSAAIVAPETAPTGGDLKLKPFSLVDQHGQAFNSSSLDGKVWIASFFFTSCPSACWKLNQELSQVQNEAAGSDLRLVSITCDPDNDTPEALDRYAKHFKADPERWTFLTGEFREIRRIGNDCFKVAVEKGTHSDRAMIVDRSGKVRGRFRLTDPTQLLVMKNLLAKVQSEAVPNGSTPGELSSSPLHPAGKDRFAR